jgi:Mitochondrial genome maintenance MGM101
MKKKKRVPIEPAKEPTDTAPAGTEMIPAALPAEIPIEPGPLESGGLYRGISQEAFAPDTVEKLLAPIMPTDVEIRPDGIIYYPEIFYRRRLNAAFGPGGWALMPRGEFTRMDDTLTRCYALFVGGRFIAESIGEMDMVRNNEEMTWATVAEGVKSNALMRTCKDIGIASECWDPTFINQWKKVYAVQVWRDGKTRPEWRRADRDPFWNERGLVLPKDKSNAEPPEQKKPEPKKPDGDKPVVTLTTAQTELYEAIKACVDKFNPRLKKMKQTELKGDVILVELTKGLPGELRTGTRSVHRLNDDQARGALKDLKLKEVQVEAFLATEEVKR